MSDDLLLCGVAHLWAKRLRSAQTGPITQGWLWRHESGTFVKFTDSGSPRVKVPKR